MGDLCLLDFTELSGMFSSSFTGSDTSKVGISVGSLLGSDGKSDSGSSLGLSDSHVLDRKLELEVSNVSKSAFSLKSEEGFMLEDSGLLEGFLCEHLEVSGVSHLVLSVSSLLSGSLEASNDSGTSSKLSSVSGDVSALVVSGGGVDILELSSLGTDESSLVEAVSVHPVRSTDDSDTSGVSTSLAIGLSLTPVLVLKSLTVDPSVTLGGLAGTDPVSLDVRLDHLSDLVLFFFGEDRYELSTPLAADASSIVPGLLLLEDFEVSDHLVGNSLEVSGFSSGNSGFLSLNSSNSSLLFSNSGGSSCASLSFLLGLDLISRGFVGLSFLDFGMGKSGSSLFLGSLLSSSSGLLFSKFLLVGELKSFSFSGSGFSSSGSISGLLGFSLSNFLITSKSGSSLSSFLFSFLLSDFGLSESSFMGGVFLGLGNGGGLSSLFSLLLSFSLSRRVISSVNFNNNSGFLRLILSSSSLSGGSLVPGGLSSHDSGETTGTGCRVSDRVFS